MSAANSSSRFRPTPVDWSMRISAAVCVFLAGVALDHPATAQGTGWGQVTLNNQTSVTLDLFVDGRYACRALPGMFCTSQEREGSHLCTAKAAEEGGGHAGPFPCPVKSGDSFTWTVAG